MNSFRAAAALLVLVGMTAIAQPVLAQGALPGLPRPRTPDRSGNPGAHARYSKAPLNMEPPELALTAALIAAGGGAAAFDAHKLLQNASASDATAQTELAAIGRKFGAAGVTSFETTCDFFISDALAQLAKSGMALPSAAASATDAKALYGGLYGAGITPAGTYDVEYMLDTLVSHIIHVQVMNDIDANTTLGPAADANFHAVFAQLLMGLKKTGAP